MSKSNQSFKKLDGDEKFCKDCINCCLWPGEVFFKENELTKVAECLGIDERTCADTFFDLAEDRIRLKTKPTNDGRCIFVDKNGCRVYSARPKQCRTFPYEWQRPEKKLMKECALYNALLKKTIGGTLSSKK